MKKNKIFKMFLVLVSLSIILPLLIIAIWSVSQQWVWPELLPSGFTLRGYKDVLSKHQDGMKLLFSSIVFSLIVAIISTIFSYLFVRGYINYDFKGKNIIYLSTLLPMLIPSNVFAMGIHVSFIKWGLSGNYLGVTISHLIYTIPYSIHTLLKISEKSFPYEEQAMVLGTNKMETFFHISLPIILPAILSSISMSYIISFSQYFLTMLIGGGQVKTFSTIMFPFITSGDRTMAGSYAMVFLVSSVLLFLVFELIINKILNYLWGNE